MPTYTDYATDTESRAIGSNADYAEVRQVLSPEYQDLSAAEIEQLFQKMFGDSLTPEDLEGFFSRIGRGLAKVGRKVAPVAATLAPIAGSAVGTLVGGPAGTAIGGALGAAAGKALSGATQRRTARRRPRRSRSRRGAPRGQRQRFSRAQASPSAARLTGLLANPQVQQALMSLLMGSAGRQSVRIAGESVPVGAIASTIEVLAREAAAEHSALQPGETASSYLLDDYGEFLVDPASQEERAALIYELIEEENEALVSDQEDKTLNLGHQHRYLQEQIDALYDELEEERLDDEAEDYDDLDDELELYDDDDEEFEL